MATPPKAVVSCPAESPAKLSIFGATQVTAQSLSPSVLDAFPDPKRREQALAIALQDSAVADVIASFTVNGLVEYFAKGFKLQLEISGYIKDALQASRDFQKGDVLLAMSEYFSVICQAFFDAVMRKAVMPGVLLDLAKLSVALGTSYTAAYWSLPPSC